MNRIFLTSAFLPLFIANISPVLAESKLTINELPEQKLNYSQKTETVMIAGIFDSIKDAVDDITDTVEDVHQTGHTIKVRDQELEERKRRQEEYEAARKAATERQRLEAERRRQYWESLSPEEKQAYVKQQRELQQKQAEVAANLFLLFLGSDGGNNEREIPDNCIGIDLNGTRESCDEQIRQMSR